MTFSFKADVDGILLTLTAERIYRSKQAERFRISINGTDYKIVIQTNRPVVELSNGGKLLQWHVVEGITTDNVKLESLYKQLENALSKYPASFQGTLNFIDHF